MPRTNLPPIKRRRLPSGVTQFYVNINNRTLGLGTDRLAAKRRLAEMVLDRDAGRLEPDAPPYAVRDLIADYLEHAARYYPARAGTREVENIRHALLQQLLPMFGELPAAQFGPVALAKVRQAMIAAVRKPRKRVRSAGEAPTPVQALGRRTINNRVHRIRRAFRWAVENERVSASVVHGLDALPGLKFGRSDARETRPIRAVSEQEITATCLHLRPSLCAMVWLQYWTGMRPGELLAMTGAQLDRSGPVWLYRPEQHKTAHLGRDRVVPIGPKAQEHLRPYLKLNPQARIFTPQQAEQERRDEQRAARKSSVTPSQQRRDERRRQKPKLSLGDAWTTVGYGLAVRRAAAAAGVPTWSPNALRHAAATRLRREVGLEAARLVLGHADPGTTLIYAEADQRQVAELMQRLG